jgi:predicted AlkP superfamily phosphohydrolase/phosphomutase/tetratricopeptide (TPR) repeat protein
VKRSQPAPVEPVRVDAARKVLLIGWDAADWKVIHPLMDAGKMPNVRRLIENGAMAQLATLHPPLSPMLWTSIATGKRPFKHGIHGFSEPLPNGLGIRPVTNLSRKCKAVWNILNQNGLRSTVIGWWPSHPAEPLRGVTVSDHYHRASRPIRDKTGPLHEIWPLLPGAVHPPELAQTLAELRFHPDELLPAMVEPFIPKAAEIDQDKDKRLASLMKILCECVSIHSAATWLIENQPWDFFAVYFDAIDHFCHGFMKYHPPRQRWIGERDFELYGNVVNQAYLFHDQMLGTLLDKAGPDTTVILMSDHGFHPDHLRPRAIPEIPAGPAIEHSDFGIFVISGPGIVKDELLYGANVLDVAPTLLALYGLPVGDDMDGKVLKGAFQDALPPASIPSWDDVPGDDGRHPPHFELDPIAASEALEQMIALGYIERPEEDIGKAVADTIDELRYNLGEAYQDDDRHYEAADIFRALFEKDPDEQRYAVHYFISCQALDRTGEMRRIVDDLDGRRRALYEQAAGKVKEFLKIVKTRSAERRAAPESDAADKSGEAGGGQSPLDLLNPEERKEFVRWRHLANYQPAVVDYLNGQVLTAEKRYAEALECLGRVTDAHLARPGLLLQTGDLYRKLGRFKEARRIYEAAIRIDPDNPHAHLGLARTALRRQQWERAANHALNCVQRLYQYPMAHFLLGAALTGLQDYPAAAAALRTAISLNPNFPAAHLRLAALLDRHLDSPEEAAEHRKLGRLMRRKAPARGPATKAVTAVSAPTLPGAALRRFKPAGAVSVDESLVVVSGLPRSGTSMLMQMLAAGGVPVLTDGVRDADEDNPRGYLEFEPVKKLFRGADWLNDAKGKAVKIVAPLLLGLPRGLPCRLIFMERDLDEILDSQAKMIARKGGAASGPERRELLKAEYARSVSRAKVWLSNRPETSWLMLNYAAVLADPHAAAASLLDFLDGRLDRDRAASFVDASLHRNRKATVPA